ncbi:hypothetical protein [Streptomyces sp. NPDC001401]|uniref:hypothetical protein n=1 Tax=Streptomyces sp. NPDC001401 TaxID=3364570 RepID=UPI00369C2E41
MASSSNGSVLEGDAGAVVGVGEVAQALGVAVQPLAERAGDVGCRLIDYGGAA